MIPHHACQGGHLPPTSQNRPRTGPSGAKPPLWLLSPALPLRVSAVYLCGTDRLPGALCRVRRVGCEPLARWAAAIPVFPLTEVSGRKPRSQGVAADPPTIPPEIGPKRPVRPHGAPPVSRPKPGPTGRQMRPQRVGGCHPFGWRLRGTRVVPGALMISLGRVRANSGAAASVPPGGTRRDDLWRDRSGFRSGSLAQSGPARGTSGRIGGQRGQWDALATSCVRGEAGRRRRAGSGEGGGRRELGSGSHPVRGVPRLRISWHVAKKRAICGRLR